ncbi:hypothetical protein D1007_59137 [Hordeum vulgare]|nr:hypothetical protein D1007_59137 [Hordeum vulgare]
MADARHVRAERRAARVIVTIPPGPCARRHSVGAKATATDPASREQQASSVHPSVQQEGRTAMASSSHAHIEWVNTQGALLMVRKLLRYRPAESDYDAWLGRITELVTTTREAHGPSRLFRPLRFVMVRRRREHRRLLPRAVNMPSPNATRARVSCLMNHYHMPKKKDIDVRSSVVRLRSTCVWPSSSSV